MLYDLGSTSDKGYVSLADEAPPVATRPPSLSTVSNHHHHSLNIIVVDLVYLEKTTKHLRVRALHLLLRVL